jgi:hypothetical protein
MLPEVGFERKWSDGKRNLTVFIASILMIKFNYLIRVIELTMISDCCA